VGKTQLAIEFGYRYAYQFEKGVYWIQGVNPKTWLNQLVDIAKYWLELKIDNLKENNTDDISTNKEEKDDNQDKKYFFKLKNYCNEFGNQMLLIIDNVDEPLSLNDENILFPNDPSSNFSLLNLGCNILFTTRKDFELPGGVIQHTLSVLLPLPSYDLLTKYHKPSSIQEEEYARYICNRVGYLPLALVLAQTFLKENFWTSFKDYDEELAKIFGIQSI
jgi:hypothetical protein